MFSLADVVRGIPLDLDLDRAGTPGRAAVVVDLTSGSLADQLEAAQILGDALPVVIGVGAAAPEQSGQPELLAACDVVVDSVDGAEPIVARIAERPRAALVLTRLLRGTESCDVRTGLAAEAAAYSMLLAGPEFAAWLAARGPARPLLASNVDVRREGEVLEVVLDRPDRRNAMDASLREQLVEALTIAIADPGLSVSLSGAGPAFSSGGDLDEFGSAPDPVTAYLVRLQRHPGWLVHQLGERIGVRLHGSCVGAGIEIPAFAARVVAAPDTVIGLPELDLGLVPGAGGTVSLTRRIGRLRTAWLVLSGERIDAGTALAWGLVDAVE